jgi:hypothetical protein
MNEHRGALGLPVRADMNASRSTLVRRPPPRSAGSRFDPSERPDRPATHRLGRYADGASEPPADALPAAPGSGAGASPAQTQ